MTARAWERGGDHDGLLTADGQIEEGQASLDAYESSMVPLEEIVLETAEEVTIDAARCGIRLLAAVVQNIKEGKEPICTLAEIGEALIGKPAIERSDTPLLQMIFERDVEIRKLNAGLAKVHPNWYEKVCLAKRQDELLRSTRKLLVMTHEALREEGRLPNDDPMMYVEDMIAELNEYAPAPEL